MEKTNKNNYNFVSIHEMFKKIKKKKELKVDISSCIREI